MSHPGCFAPSPSNELLLFIQETTRTSGPVWMGEEILVPKRIRFPDRPAHSESLRLRYTIPLSYTNRYRFHSTTSSVNIPLQNVLEILLRVSELTRVHIGKDKSSPLGQLTSPRRTLAFNHLDTLLAVNPTSLGKCVFYKYIKVRTRFTSNFS
jgi:hypothetical protein